ncbi:cell division protein ZapD [Sutterella sp.]|uniref:cell division protein ZapD n=1 Tax=Sutterella sp. TaxID=1981025 RepID=UPI0026E0D695|nr:cell division protein ZapD [Sutterella sp.]MDO5530821.1 cell division protein ZapD [Sutterella sp.]
MQTSGQLLYEFPFSEKVRFYLRFETLARRYLWFVEQNSPIAHQSAIGTLFDLSDVAARSDLKNDLVKELSREQRDLEAQRAQSAGDAVTSDELTRRIEELKLVSRQVTQIVGRSGQNIRDLQWLQLVRNRQPLPGGTCEFDMPFLHFWLAQSAEERRRELRELSATLSPTINAVAIILRHLRSTTEMHNAHAVKGVAQVPVNGRNYSLCRIWIRSGSNLIPEVSANKFALFIRLSRPDEQHILHYTTEEIDFQIGLCH